MPDKFSEGIAIITTCSVCANAEMPNRPEMTNGPFSGVYAAPVPNLLLRPFHAGSNRIVVFRNVFGFSSPRYVIRQAAIRRRDCSDK